MSKSGSNLFKYTAGASADLVKELDQSGEKHNSNDIVGITRDPITGKLAWLENGNTSAGLNHILDQHGKQFNDKGISNEELPHYIMEAINQGRIIDYQGSGTTRPIYEFVYKGEIQQIAITIGNNGFIVGANPRSIKEYKED